MKQCQKCLLNYASEECPRCGTFQGTKDERVVRLVRVAIGNELEKHYECRSEIDSLHPMGRAGKVVGFHQALLWLDRVITLAEKKIHNEDKKKATP